MIEMLFFIVGMILGGLVSFVILCCFQLHRINRYEAQLLEGNRRECQKVTLSIAVYGTHATGWRLGRRLKEFEKWKL